MQELYGPPNGIAQFKYVPVQVAYGPYPSQTPATISRIIISTITSPLLIILSFIVGTILYLITHKKIFIIIPLILSFLYLLRYLIETFLN